MWLARDDCHDWVLADIPSSQALAALHPPLGLHDVETAANCCQPRPGEDSMVAIKECPLSSAKGGTVLFCWWLKEGYYTVLLMTQGGVLYCTVDDWRRGTILYCWWLKEGYRTVLLMSLQVTKGGLQCPFKSLKGGYNIPSSHTQPAQWHNVCPFKSLKGGYNVPSSAAQLLYGPVLVFFV